jgi:hypothetical protein
MKVEGFIQHTAEDYAQFLNQTPWYKYPFFKRWKEFIHVRDGEGTSFTRRWERRFAFTFEMWFKGAYAGIIRFATGKAYLPEDLNTYAMVRKDGAPEIIPIKRYAAFTPAMEKLAADGVEFSDIAGNGRIMLTVIAPRKWQNKTSAATFYEWPVLTEPKLKRVSLIAPVGDLSALIRDFSSGEAKIDHIFDY